MSLSHYVLYYYMNLIKKFLRAIFFAKCDFLEYKPHYYIIKLKPLKKIFFFWRQMIPHQDSMLHPFYAGSRFLLKQLLISGMFGCTSFSFLFFKKKINSLNVLKKNYKNHV